jgi:hypothetical protein
MKTLNYNILAFFILLSTVTFAQKIDKKINEKFDVNKNTNLIISNAFGNVVIQNTNSNTIDISIEIKVEAHTQKKAEKIYDKISVEILKTGNTIKAKTNIDNISSSGSCSFEINYTIVMPSYISTDLSNKYGDVIINELIGKNTINIKYGSLNANRIIDDNTKPLTSVELGFCSKSRINEFNWGKIIVKYSELQIDKGQAVVVSSKYSDLTLGNFSSIVSECSFDDYKIEKATNVVMNAKYTDITVKNIKNKLDITDKYGDINIKNIASSFTKININSKFTDVNVEVDDNAEFKMQLSVEYGDIDIDIDNFTIVKRIKSDFDISISGYKGNESAIPFINITSKYGDVDVSDM